MSVEKFAAFRQQVAEVFPWGLRVKARLIHLQKLDKQVRVLCPNPVHKGANPPVYVWVWVGGPRQHLHMGCEDPDCYYRMME